MDISLLASIFSTFSPFSPFQFNLNDLLFPMREFLVNNLSAIQSFLGTFLGTFLGAAVPIVLFLLRQHSESRNRQKEFNDRLRRICNLLLVDMQERENWLSDVAYENRKIKRNGHWQNSIDYSENVFSTANYHSVVYSGLITYFQKDTQTEITKFYHYVELHNKRIYDMNDIINSNALASDVSKIENSSAWINNQEQLTIYENEIKNRLPEVKDKIVSELQRLKT